MWLRSITQNGTVAKYFKVIIIIILINIITIIKMLIKNNKWTPVYYSWDRYLNIFKN